MNKQVHLLGIPFGLGGSKRGTQDGPETLIANGLRAYLEGRGVSTSYTNLAHASDDPGIFSSVPILAGRICSEHAVSAVAKITAAHVFRAHTLGQMPVILGGDHSVSLGSLTQFLNPRFSRGRKVGLVWIDAHYDAHTPKTSYSHFANGLPFASALGRGASSVASYHYSKKGKRGRRLRFEPEYTLHIGAGNTDCEDAEIRLLDTLGVQRVGMDEIHRTGVTAFIHPLERLIASVDDIILTIDLDAIRKDFAPAVSFQSIDGLLPAHLSIMASRLLRSKKMRQIEIMEYNPDFEEYAEGGGRITADLVTRLLGQLLS